jgi:hypothetical protein
MLLDAKDGAVAVDTGTVLVLLSTDATARVFAGGDLRRRPAAPA